ncbi:hypothetical protein SAMN05421736_1512 [Evansella caseinilytica]|uniref:Uncharacterized protein n=1 Tax=Evansella caseinilytica TaxID=1503961 RepID=A0A1H3V562_9BACI|nr:hypothetical protein [Evansella caseinilytica]SDZ69165.1 hypothetical protein SAMN05421736_1512 [Evansella caseinilytica]
MSTRMLFIVSVLVCFVFVVGSVVLAEGSKSEQASESEEVTVAQTRPTVSLSPTSTTIRGGGSKDFTVKIGGTYGSGPYEKTFNYDARREDNRYRSINYNVSATFSHRYLAPSSGSVTYNTYAIAADQNISSYRVNGTVTVTSQ